MMDESNKLLSDLVAFRTYAKHLPHLARRESLEETINRNMMMQLDKFPKLSRDIVKAFDNVHALKVMPSMRGLQFAGDAILKNNARQYNCSYLPINDVRCFGETLFLLLSGVGVGFSVQKSHVNSLPKIQNPREEGTFVAHDSILGWAQALDALMEAYCFGRIRPVFDLSNIRAKGSYLVTTGAKAPGPEPLRYMLNLVESKLKLAEGRKLKPIEVHDIVCIISDCVLSGGIRRAALISLFDREDDEMLKCKSGEWWVKHPYRARANNSVVLPRSLVTKEEFDYIFSILKASGSGEPGFSWTDNTDWGFNPCHEIALNPNQFCNLTTINQTGIDSKQEFLKRVHSATLLGTLQAAYTDFPYLRPIWKETTEKEALLGISFTGIADANGIVQADWLRDGAKLVLELNEKYSKKLGINVAARTTTVKPEGSSSCVLGSSSGIHARHNDFYLRRFRINKGDSLDNYLRNVIPDLVEDDKFSNTGSVVTIPQRSPNKAITRNNENAMDLLNRVYMYNEHWVKQGYRSGDNQHNVSATISVKDSEWDEVRESMWNNRHLYSGISLLPYDGGTYVQAPFEDCTKDIYDQYMNKVKTIDLRQIVETEDNTTKTETVACSGGVCELTSI